MTKDTFKHNKYAVNQKQEHFDDVSFRELSLESQWLLYKISFVSS